MGSINQRSQLKAHAGNQCMLTALRHLTATATARLVSHTTKSIPRTSRLQDSDSVDNPFCMLRHCTKDAGVKHPIDCEEYEGGDGPNWFLSNSEICLGLNDN
ncbi:hypothetical protein J6590_002841 [Homalodisca vitripennis]|nr:hypothetical protein J6590_002841 [Homalodisca vitripennis]